ncbi:MAG: FliM/FliN family flagellar motor switch protein, partial [Paracoccaceae bacterium]
MDETGSIATTPQSGAADQNGPFSRVPIEVTISIGRARPLVCDLLQLKQNSVLALEQRVDDPVELYVGPRLVARGELEELDGEQK